MRKDPSDLIDQVVDETSFLQFLAALKDDWDDERAKESAAPSSPYGPGANGWQNGTIGAFLEAAMAWASDMPAERWAELFGDRATAENTWRRVAHMLLAGKYYE
jgi:hypothetical protein